MKLNENGFPFAYIFDGKYKTIFGHTKKDMNVDSNDAEEEDTDSEEDTENLTKRKLNAYMQYAKNINEEEAMDIKDSYLRYIDAIIAGNPEAEKLAGSEIAELKTRELLGVNAQVNEDMELTNGFVVKMNDDVVHHGDVIGKIKYKDDQMYLTLKSDNSVTEVPNNDPAELSKLLYAKVLGKRS